MNTFGNNVLINGYIREIQLTLPRSVIVPIDMISLCHSFWRNDTKILILPLLKETYRSYDSNQIRILHHDSNSISNIIHSLSPTNDVFLSLSPPICYIPNISSQINISEMNTNKSYDGILYIQCQDSGFCYMTDRYPTFLLFESNHINNTQINCHLIKSTKKLPCDHFDDREGYGNHVECRGFVNCGHHGIIYEHNGDLYQLKLQNVMDKNFFFKKIDVNKLWEYENWKNYGKRKYLSMIYLPTIQSIMAIYISWDRYPQKTSFNSNGEIMEWIDSGIFDLNKLEWKSIAEWTFDRYRIDQYSYYHYALCYDHDGYDKNVYAVSNVGHVIKYDIIKNEWCNLIDSGLNLKYGYVKSGHIAWIDNRNIIYCSDGQYFGSLDIGQHKPEWNELSDLKKVITHLDVDSDCTIYLYL